MRVVIAVVMALMLSARASAQTPTWTGFYAGVVGGAADGSPDIRVTLTAPYGSFLGPPDVQALTTASAKRIGPLWKLLGSAAVGYDWQHGVFVFGLAADVGSLSFSGSRSVTTPFPDNGYPFTVTQSVSTHGRVPVSGRVGRTKGHVLLYGTGGIAITTLNYQAVYTDAVAGATTHESGGGSGTRTGWTAGGGIECRVAKHSSLKMEYLFIDSHSVSTTSSNLTRQIQGQGTVGMYYDNVFINAANLHVQVLRVGWNFRF
jgi:outer membrane immunogenic protein